jgi:esterase/lipase superfamily enzyme
VHVIAHSMGNRGLLRSMQRIASGAQHTARTVFGHIVLAAPDIEARVFRDLVRVYERVAVRTTLYASSKDRALVSSGIVGVLGDRSRPPQGRILAPRDFRQEP